LFEVAQHESCRGETLLKYLRPPGPLCGVGKLCENVVLLFPRLLAKKLDCSFGLPASDVLTGDVLAKLSSSVFNYKRDWSTDGGRGGGGVEMECRSG